MLLADRGELALDDKARKFIPEFREGSRADITIRHLLTHTSGLPDQLPENVAMRKRNAPLSEFVARALRTPLLFQPGERYGYQSMGILLAAEICERITAVPFPEFLSRELFGPLGMKHSALGLGSIALADTERSQVEQGPPHSGRGKPEAAHWDWNSPYWRNLASPWGGGSCHRRRRCPVFRGIPVPRQGASAPAGYRQADGAKSNPRACPVPRPRFCVGRRRGARIARPGHFGTAAPRELSLGPTRQKICRSCC